LEEDKIRIFLTDQARSRTGSNSVVQLSKEIMIAVSDFYKNPNEANDFRKVYGMTSRHTAGLDSGGFQFLMGKLKVENSEVLPCGLEVPASAKETVEIYKRMGVLKKDYPIQLDLPPRFDQDPNTRKQLITRSAGYYYEMAEELPWVVPVHGWSLEEMKFNLELLMDPDKARIAMGTYAAETRGVWTMGNLNPHKPKSLGVGSMKAFHNSENYLPFTDNHANKDRDKLAIGSYKAFTHNSYYKDHVKQGKAVASPVPGRLDVGIDEPFIDKVKSRVATPVPTKVDAGIQTPRTTPMVAAPSRKPVAVGSFIASAVGADGGAAVNPSRKRMAVGTFIANTTGPLGEKLAVGTYAATATTPVGELISKKKAPIKSRVSFTVILDRIAMALNLLKPDYEVFMLGGASPHMVHQIFMSGASWTDTSAWRIKALMAEIYLWDHSTGHSSFNIGYSTKNKQIDDEGVEILRECLQNSTHPLNGMTVDRFLAIGKMNMKEWRSTWKENQWEVKPFKLRAQHNAWVLKEVVEPVARDYAADPDGYYKYLSNCLEPRPILSKRLRYLYDKLHQPYVQTDLEVYLK